MQNSSGFTLLEIVISLFLLAIVAAIAGMGAVSGFRVYVMTRENAHTAQKVQMAMARISRELLEMSSIPQNGVNASPTHIIFDIKNERRALAHAGENIVIHTGIPPTSTTLPGGGDILIDKINAFQLNFWQGSIPWTLNGDLRLLSAIDVTLSVDIGDHSMDFSTTIHPRNIINYGGASVPTTLPTHLASAYCFINTAQHGTVGMIQRLLAGYPFLYAAMIILSLLFCCRARMHLKRRADSLPSHGSALIGIIIAMMVFSAVAAVMLPMVSTSIYTQAGGNSTAKAQYLAESGYRYAASQYLNAGASDSAKNDQLRDLDGKTYSLSGNQGQFSIDIYPYFFETTAIPSGNSLQTRVPGSYPYVAPNDLPTSGKLKIGPDTYSYSAVNVSAAPVVVFTLDAAAGSLPLYPLQSNVFLVATGESFSQTPEQGLAITMANGSGDGFPPRNGEVIIADKVYAYRYRSGNNLIGLFDPTNPFDTAVTHSFDFTNNSDIVLHKYVRLHSSGSYGSGAMATGREVIYHTPLPIIEAIENKMVFYDPFDTSDNWGSSVANLEKGSFGIENIASNSALQVTGYQQTGSIRKALKALNWDGRVDLAHIHKYSDHYLSYDAQIKVGFANSDGVTPPAGWYPEEPIPRYFTAGLSFRLDSGGYSYGISFQRGNRNGSPFEGNDYADWETPDNIEDEMVPVDTKPLIVLWKLSDGTKVSPTRNPETWIAYKSLETEFFSDDAEGDDSNWEPLDANWRRSSDRYHAGSYSWHESPGGNYANDLEAILESNEINLDLDCACTLCRAELRFWNRYLLASGDVAYVEYSPDDGVNWYVLETYSGTDNTWKPELIPLENAGVRLTGPIKIRFRLVSDGVNVADGWFVDDIRIAVDLPMRDSTLAVRLQESAVLVFKNARAEIFSGTIITGPSGTAIADGAPRISGGDWGDANGASGLVLLRDVAGTFAADEDLSIGAISSAAKVDFYRNRENLIKVYYGTADGCKTANGDPFDLAMAASPRGGLFWPPEEDQDWIEAKDHFQLIRWDGVNTNFVQSDGSGSAKLVTYGDDAGALLRSWDADLLTGTSEFTVLTRPEFGLHAFGKGLEEVYFDDFGLKAIYPVTAKAVTPPVQE